MKSRLVAPWPFFVIVLLLAGLPLGRFALGQAPAASPKPDTEKAAAAAIPEEDLGLSKTDVFSTPSPPRVVENTAEPGEAPLLPRAYPGAPPRIPHTITDFVPITREDNLCLDCHLIDEKVEGGPIPIPASHKTDLRREPGKTGDAVVGARWICVSCHVPKTGAEPLVANRFGEEEKPEMP